MNVVTYDLCSCAVKLIRLLILSFHVLYSICIVFPLAFASMFASFLMYCIRTISFFCSFNRYGILQASLSLSS